MSFQTPKTIADTLEGMHRHDYVLPAIQREFVWREDKVVRLFDSLMRGYPIGSFLFWKIDPEHTSDFVYYDFIRDFHIRDRRHCERLAVSQVRSVTAILDGQQRLTSLNIGLSGSYADKLPWKRWSNPNAYPKTHLYLDLAHEPEPDDDMRYRFAFLTKETAQRESEGLTTGAAWFQVAHILGMTKLNHVMQWLAINELGNDVGASDRLATLHSVVHTDKTINYFEETEQDIDRVLDIFIRVNSGGMVLSQSDLLLSIATAQWTERDAREEILGLVDDLNRIHHGFDFSKDLVLKAGLVMTDARDIRFRVQNFNRDNMAELDKQWDGIAAALTTAVLLLSRFGFSAGTLPSNSVLIPLADWVHRHSWSSELVSSPSQREQRDQIRGWVLRSQLKAGVFGSGLDTLLAGLRKVVRDASTPEFPVAALEREMGRQGKAPRFSGEELEDLSEMKFGNSRVFALLTILYPGVDVNGDYHIDHIFPRSKFSKAELGKAGVADDALDEYRDRVDRLPNLQLLEGPENESKRDRLPGVWISDFMTDEQRRDEYIARHDLQGLGTELTAFPNFYERRRAVLQRRLREELGAPPAETAET